MDTTDRMECLRKHMYEISQTRETLTVTQFQELTPDWLPKYPVDFLRRNGVSWQQFLSDFGMKMPKYRKGSVAREVRCECGNMVVDGLEISFTCLNPSGDDVYKEMLPVCRRCFYEFDAMERLKFP